METFLDYECSLLSTEGFPGDKVIIIRPEDSYMVRLINHVLKNIIADKIAEHSFVSDGDTTRQSAMNETSDGIEIQRGNKIFKECQPGSLNQNKRTEHQDEKEKHCT